VSIIKLNLDLLEADTVINAKDQYGKSVRIMCDPIGHYRLVTKEFQYKSLSLDVEYFVEAEDLAAYLLRIKLNSILPLQEHILDDEQIVETLLTGLFDAGLVITAKN
jgi:hypothetical protein